eukprot:SAG22_NODE_666_length_8013_cov_2.524640_1_plen_172_part_10
MVATTLEQQTIAPRDDTLAVETATSCTPPSLEHLAEEELWELMSAPAQATTDPILDPRGPCVGVVGSGAYDGQSCSAAWCCIAAQSGVPAANAWCEALVYYGCRRDTGYLGGVSMCPDRCTRIRDITDHDPEVRNKRILKELLMHEGVASDKAIAIADSLIRKTATKDGLQP